MAKIYIKTISESNPEATIPFGTVMCGSPVVVTCSVDDGFFPATATACRLQLRVVRCDDPTKSVKEQLAVNAADSTKYQPIEWLAVNGEEYTQDIRLALSGLMGVLDFDPNAITTDGKPIQLPMLRYGLVLGYTYLLDGEITDSLARNSPNNAMLDSENFAIRGALTDMEMYRYSMLPWNKQNGITFDHAMPLSRKPRGEIIPKGALWCRTWLHKLTYQETDGGYSGVSQQPPIIEVYREGDMLDELKLQLGIYVDDETRNYREFIFINSLGCPETIYARCMDKKSEEINSKSYRRVTTPSRRPQTGINSITILSDATYETYEMSSGAVSEEWQQWWVGEFLSARHWWMHVDDIWVPVTISPAKKTQTLFDHTKSTTLSVDFTVTMTMTRSTNTNLF